MAISTNKPDSWREALKFLNRCPICSSSYEVEKAALFASNETANLVHLTCSKCQSYFVAMILIVGQGLSSVGMVTDLSYEDISRLYKVSPLTTDEIIRGYEAIEAKYFIHSLILNG